MKSDNQNNQQDVLRPICAKNLIVIRLTVTERDWSRAKNVDFDFKEYSFQRKRIEDNDCTDSNSMEPIQLPFYCRMNKVIPIVQLTSKERTVYRLDKERDFQIRF